ncbi:MAG: GNAT family N-acetyltransferase [Desulfuromonadaceae bacterium]|nr:GNAT family N-acetyltransferase [Desulfuromonadaceae bacterium]
MITSIRNATDEEWDYFADSAESAIYFQTREWFDIWADYAGFENDTKLISFESGKKALLPLTRLKLFKGVVTAHFLAPKGMGGFLTIGALSAEERGDLSNLLKSLKMLRCVVNPYDELTNQLPGLNSEDSTQYLDLTRGFELIFKEWAMGHYTRTKKGLRQGIVVEQAGTEEDWRNYFDIYQDNLSRWGKSATNDYAWELFESLYKRRSPKIKLWLARHDGNLISGALCFYHNRHVAYWHSATSQTFYKKLNATHVLQYQIIKDACDKGFLIYDFLPSSGIEGVIEFKGGFSPQLKQVRIYESPFMQLSRVLRNRLRNSAAYKFVMKNTGF